MKKTFLLTAFICTISFTFAQSIIFNGNSLESYQNQQVTFSQTLHVCGHYNHNLYLSYERLRAPEEQATYGSQLLDSLRAKNRDAILTAYCPNILTDTVRLGSTLTNVTATVTGARSIRINGNPVIAGNTRPTTPPSVGNARLLVCAANLQYYCPLWEGTNGAGSDDEFAIQHLKTTKALANIGADIFAFEELQQGIEALESLADGLNGLTAPGRYAYLADNDMESSTYTKVGILYRTDKVRPVRHLGFPYGPGAYATAYHLRLYVQQFEEIATGERFTLSINHFHSKSGSDSTTNYNNGERVDNAEHLSDFLTNELENNYYDDPDVLIVGDLNCMTMEEPVRYLEFEGYANQLTRFSPDDYSYTYNDEVEYLDHALASPSLAEQITGARPYHLNSDESYKHHYEYGDTTMYRYSDHDPILIGLNLSSTPDLLCHDLDYEQRFAQTFGSFTTQDVQGNSFWYINTDYDCAYINGYSSGNNEDWLVSPSYDLTFQRDIRFSFEQTMGYGSISSWPQQCQLLVATDYDGDVRTATWQELPLASYPASNWSWTTNNLLLPTQYEGEGSVTLAFKYKVTQGSIPAWEIKNFEMDGTCSVDSTAIAEYDNSEVHFAVNSIPNGFQISTDFNENIAIYDLQGRQLAFRKQVQELTFTAPAGIYLVRVGQEVSKVAVP